MPHRLIMVVEDDSEDRELFENIMSELNVTQKRLYFDNAMNAFSYLSTTQEEMFIIISDINMPGWNGLEFKKKIDANRKLRLKSIPFVFFSTSGDPKAITEAYDSLTVQGYFEKPNTPSQYKAAVASILDYWKRCKRPAV